MQREHPDVVSVVYSGDNASKEEIIGTVQVRTPKMPSVVYQGLIPNLGSI